MDEPAIVIPISEYNALIEDSLFLQCLRNHGVDNWDGYDYAVDEYNEDN